MDFNNTTTQITLFIVLFLMALSIIGLYIYIKETNKKLNISSPNKEGNKLKLQAFERLTLYAERTSLKNLVSRVPSTGLNVVDMQLALQEIIKSEYEYNASQQLYIDADMWKAITNLKDQNIYIINQLAATLPSDANAIELSKRILEYTSNNNAELSQIVLEALRYEAKKIL